MFSGTVNPFVAARVDWEDYGGRNGWGKGGVRREEKLTGGDPRWLCGLGS